MENNPIIKEPGEWGAPRKMSARRICYLVLFLVLVGTVGNAQVLSTDDQFIAGYATAVLVRELNLNNVSVSVENGIVRVEKEGSFQKSERENITETLLNVTGVRGVKVDGTLFVSTGRASGESLSEIDAVKRTECKEVSTVKETVFLPSGFLFDPLIADPRWPHFSAAYQYYFQGDDLKSVGAVSFGESFSIVRGSAPFDGQWELGVQAAVFSIFDLDASSYDLINADYWVGVPVTYRRGNFSTMLRVFHQSSHLGDEYLLRDDSVKRINLSYEGVDLFVSHDLAGMFRLYYGGGRLVSPSPSDFDPWTVHYGFEAEYTRSFWKSRLRPVFGIDVKHWEEMHWNLDASVRGGVQLENHLFQGHKIQLMVEYYNGHSPNGQFYLTDIEYLGLGAHFYF